MIYYLPITRTALRRLSLILLFITGFIYAGSAQTTVATEEKHGNVLNLGVGIGGYSGYYRNIGAYVPVVHLDYEFDVAKNFTLAPFINFYTYTASYHLSNPSRDYYYKINIVPIGVKGTYYLDKFLEAGPKWDFYIAGSLGFVLVRTSWNDNYYVDNGYYKGYYFNHGNQLFLDAHVGTEYHINEKVGIFLDLSNGLSTAGISIH